MSKLCQQILVPTADGPQVVEVLKKVELTLDGFRVLLAIHKSLCGEGFVAAEWHTGRLVAPKRTKHNGTIGAGIPYPTVAAALVGAKTVLQETIAERGIESLAMVIRIAQFDQIDGFLNGPDGYTDPQGL